MLFANFISVLLYRKMANLDSFDRNYEANVVILFQLLLEMISALNLLKRFQPYFNCIVTL